MKKLVAIITLIILLMFSGVFCINVQAASYSSKFTSVEIPSKYENYYESTDDESEWESYEHYTGDDKYISVHYDVYERYISGLTIYTQTHLSDFVSDLTTYANEYNYNLKILHQQLIENNGCKGMRIAYKLYDPEFGSSWFYDDYYFLTDNYEVELSFTSTDSTFIDSQEQQAIVKSFKIKDTVLKSRGIPFTDVPSDSWYYDAVKYVYDNNIIKGTNDYTFAPNSKLTRGMLVTILHRMEGSPAISGTSKFPDVQNTSQYYYTAVKWATQNNIVSGYNNGNFGPNDPITREQLAVILSKYSKYKGKYTAATANLSGYKDASKISNFAKEGMNWAVASGVITGNASSKTLNPQGTTTRAEAASMLYKYCTKIK